MPPLLALCSASIARTVDQVAKFNRKLFAAACLAGATGAAIEICKYYRSLVRTQNPA